MLANTIMDIFKWYVLLVFFSFICIVLHPETFFIDMTETQKNLNSLKETVHLSNI